MLAYQILTCGNPRAAGANLWEIELRDGPAGGLRRRLSILEPVGDRCCDNDFALDEMISPALGGEGEPSLAEREWCFVGRSMRDRVDL